MCRGQKTLKSQKTKWWQKPLVTTAFYTDLTKGAWHATFYTLVHTLQLGLATFYTPWAMGMLSSSHWNKQPGMLPCTHCYIQLGQTYVYTCTGTYSWGMPSPARLNIQLGNGMLHSAHYSIQLGACNLLHNGTYS